MAVFGLGAVGLIFGYAVLQYGGVEFGDWYLCLTALGLCCFLYWSVAKKSLLAPRSSLLLRILLVSLLTISFLQIVPLPVGLVNAVSANRVELIEALKPILTPADSATLSISPAVSFGVILTMAAYVLLFVFMRTLCWRFREHPWLVSAPFVAVALAEAILGILQVHIAGAQEAKGTYVNRNHFAGFIELALPFPLMHGVAILASSRRRHSTSMLPAVAACLLLAVATVLLLANLLSLSRMGFIASLGALLTMGIVALSNRLEGRQKWVPVIGFTLLIAIAFIFLPSDQLIGRFADVAATETLSTDTRAEIWRDTFKLIRAYPLAGCGLGAYESGFCRYQAAAPLLTVDAAHNDYLQLLSELGVFGFAIVLFLAVLMFRNAFSRAYRLTGNARYVAIACAGSLTAIALHSFVDFNLYIPANGMLVVWIAAISEGLIFFEKSRRHSSSGRRERSFVENREVRGSANL